MAGSAVTLDGAGQLRRALAQLDLDKQLGPVHRGVAQLVAARAAAAAPRQSGRLAASVAGHTTDRSAVIVAAVPYAGVIHWGWPARHIGANTFVADAARGAEAQWSKLYRDGIQALLDDAAAAT